MATVEQPSDALWDDLVDQNDRRADPTRYRATPC